MPHFPPYHQYSDFLSPAEELALLDWAIANQNAFKPSTVGPGIVDPERRKSQRLVDLGPCHAGFEHRVCAAAQDLFERTGTAPFDIEFVELEIAAHGDGAHFAVHTDMPLGWGRSPLGGDSSGTQDRIVSAVYYFYREPKRFTGGELRLRRLDTDSAEGDFIDVEPRRNSLVVFPSWAAHEVRTVQCDSEDFGDYRFAVNCWLCRTLPK